MTIHPDHDEVTREVRSWYTSSKPGIGLVAVRETFGFLTNSRAGTLGRLVLTVDDPEQVAAALESAAEFFEGSSFEVWVDEPRRAEHLACAMDEVGLEAVQDTVVLALVGPIRAEPGPDALTVEDVVDLAGLREWSTVKIQGFADSEEPPAGDRLDAEVATWQSEWPVCCYQTARMDGEAVSILGHYTGQDQMVFNLATRVPFRHRRIGQALLAQWTQRAESERVRSRLINCDAKGPAAALYRRLGFTDEVYWHRRYGRRR